MGVGHAAIIPRCADPPVGAGATHLKGFTFQPLGRVSILTRPWGRVQRGRARIHHLRVCVSILTRPWGRVQRPNPTPRHHPRLQLRFNPHPPVGAGATLIVVNGASQFQSSPARGGGCQILRQIHLVSILTRPWGRVQHRLYASMFQSSPARGGGCNARFASRRFTSAGVSILTRPWGRVQRCRSSFRDRVHCFNPHPPVGAGATRLGERAGAVPQTQVFQLSRCAVPRSGRLTAGHSPTDTRYAASRPAAARPLAPRSR
jgi:hypothetical protein